MTGSHDAAAAAPALHAAPIGLICAIPQELEHLLTGAETVHRDGGFTFHRTQVEGRDVVLVETGIGKVNTAVVTTLLLREFGCRTVVFTGVAGGLDPALGVGDVVVADRVVQHDYGAIVGETFITYQPGNFPMPDQDRSHGYDLPAATRDALHRALDGLALPTLSAAVTGDAPRTPRVVFGTILSGDSFINCEATRVRLHRDFRGQAVEMEGAAMAQVAERFGARWVVVRCLSDLAGGSSHMDFMSFIGTAATNAATVVRRILREL